MSLSLYTDQHVHEAITQGLLRRGIDVLTARADGHERQRDEAILERATSLGRVLLHRTSISSRLPIGGPTRVADSLASHSRISDQSRSVRLSFIWRLSAKFWRQKKWRTNSFACRSESVQSQRRRIGAPHSSFFFTGRLLRNGPVPGAASASSSPSSARLTDSSITSIAKGLRR
jgi:hypothetical protein